MTKEQLVEVLRKNADENPCQFACEECNEADCLTPVLRTTADLVEQQAARIAELEAKVPRWIPVTEKIPPDQEEVLVLTRSKNGVRNVDKGYWAIDHFIHRGRAEVTHWMPLPEPPETDGGGKDG